MYPPISLDITRLLNRSRRTTPTGIDRVELAYAKWLTRQEQGTAVSTRWLGYPRLLDRAEVRQIIEEADAAWSGLLPNVTSESEFHHILGFLGRPPGVPRETIKSDRPSPKHFWLRGSLQTARRDAALLLKSVNPSRTVPPNNVFLHVSHTGLQYASRIRALLQSGAPAIFFVHDLIPIEAPEFCRPGEDLRHERRMQTVADYASVVIVNSHSTELSFREHCKRRHWRQPPVEVIPLGVDPLFMTSDAVPEIVAGNPYFVMVGTIEPRKNHLLLLHLWRRMVKQIGSNTPRLVIIGRRGWENENVADLLERCDLIRDHVIEANDLHDLHVAQLIRGATALLAPSFLEGYGLPIVEALSLGTSVIASDIPAHHDAGDGFVDFIDPLNGGEWLAAIAAYSQRSGRNSAVRGKTSRYNPPSWSNHFAQVELLLKSSFASVSRTLR